MSGTESTDEREIRERYGANRRKSGRNSGRGGEEEVAYNK